MSKKNISQEKIIQSFLYSAFDKSAGATSLSDISDSLEIKKASLYNHFESREAMYDASIELCSKEIGAVNFLFDKTIEGIKSGKNTFIPLMKRLTTRYFNLFESEPLFQMYVFVHTEQYFNITALRIVERQIEKLSDEIKKILTAFVETEKIAKKNEREIKDIAGCLASIIIQQLDNYVALRKETVRQNPDSGVGSLFALPPDEETINKSLKMIEAVLKVL